MGGRRAELALPRYGLGFFSLPHRHGGMIDGLSSGLISRKHFENNYCYYYLDLSRMLPVEESVPKSISVLGQNQSLKALDLGIKSPRRPYLSGRGRSKALGQTELVSTVSEEQWFAPLLGARTAVVLYA